MDVPAGVTQEEGNTGFSINLLSAVLALIFLARRIQPFLSLVDREVEFCVLTILIVLHPLGIFISFFCFFSEKNPVCRDRTHVPTCQRLHGTSELPRRPVVLVSIIVLDLSLLFDDVLFCLPFCWCPCMAINVSVQYHRGTAQETRPSDDFVQPCP